MDFIPGQLMAAEIAEQPRVLHRLLTDGAESILEVGRQLALRKPRFVLFAARGTSDHAALFGKYLTEIEVGLPAGLISPSSSTVYGARADLRECLFVAVSQSGGSPDLVDSLSVARRCGATTVAVTNNVASDLADAAAFTVDVCAGVERAVAATKSYTAQLLALFLLLSSLRVSGINALERAAPLAEAAQETLDSGADIAAVAARLRFATRLITTARGYSYPSAREGALKLMETSYLSALAFSGADLLHGPLAIIDADQPVIAIVSPGRGGDAMLPVLRALQERKADLTVVGAAPARVHDGEGQLQVATTGVAEELLPILEILPLQQLALRLALDRGGDPDSPRGLSKVTETW